MSIDDRIKQNIAMLSEPVIDVEGGLSETVRRGRRKRRATLMVQSAVTMAFVAAAVAGTLAIKEARIETDLVGPIGGEGAPPELCGDLNVEGMVRQVEMSRDGGTIAMELTEYPSYRGPQPIDVRPSTVIVCSDRGSFIRAREADRAWVGSHRAQLVTDPAFGDSQSLSHDGKFFVFDSYKRLTPDDRDERKDIFLLDVQSGALRRLDLGPGEVFGPHLDAGGSRMTYAAKDEADHFSGFEYSFSTGKSAPVALSTLRETRLKGSRIIDPRRRFQMTMKTREMEPRDLVKDPRARASGTILIHDSSGAVVRTISVPRQPLGTRRISGTGVVSEDGRTLIVDLARSVLNAFQDGTVLRLLRDGTSKPLGSRRFKVGSLIYEIPATEQGSSQLYEVDLSHGTFREIDLPPGWEVSTIASASDDLSRVAIRAENPRHHPRTVDLLLLAPETQEARVLTWHPSLLDRYRRVIIVAVATLLILLAGAVAMRRLRGSRRL